MNLYTTTPTKLSERTSKINSHTIYLATLAKERPDTDVDFKLITTLQEGDRKLFVLNSAGKYYLAPNFILGEGISNILYSSEKCARVIKYGQQYIKRETI